ncbi:hypothetical protein MD484_g6311, partial [Candolleomyces efflorescens]
MPASQASKDEMPTTPPRPIKEPGPPNNSVLSREDEKKLRESGELFIEHQKLSTPFGPALLKPLKINPNRDDHKAAIRVELGAIRVLPNDEWVKTLYVDLVEDSEKPPFIKREIAAGLFYPKAIINAILNRFVLQRGKNRKQRMILRKAVDTHTKNILHEEKYATTRFSRPDVSVKAQGDSFEEPKVKPGHEVPEVGFSNMSSFMEMKVNHREKSPKVQGLQVGVYVRQIFIQQPNRRFVRVLLLTEKNLRFFHFDRSGAMCSSYIDIHKNPGTFIRLVVGLNSLDESVLGFDTSIKWVIEDGRKIGGTLTTWSPNDPETKMNYQLCDVNPIDRSHDIRGRGTRCWHVSDPETHTEYWVKDCWRAEDRVSEHIYHEEAMDCPGVAQMVAFEENRWETKSFRGEDGIAHKDFHNRVAARIVTYCYGLCIRNFSCALELLRAMRDAIIGHMKLFGKDILHRDITMESILLGIKGNDGKPEKGNWGVLSNLHMAIKVDRDTKKVSMEWRTGPRTYLSLEILRNCKRLDKPKEITPAQDHLDDLESFLYVYNHILSQYDADGQELAELDEDILGWVTEDARTAIHLKTSFLSRTSAPPILKERWPPACINVLLAFREFISQQVTRKSEVHDNVLVLADRAEEIKKIVARIDTHYNTVLCIFNSGVAQLEKEERDGAHTHSLDPQSPTPAGRKRKTLYESNPGTTSQRGLNDLSGEDSEDTDAGESSDVAV